MKLEVWSIACVSCGSDMEPIFEGKSLRRWDCPDCEATETAEQAIVRGFGALPEPPEVQPKWMQLRPDPRKLVLRRLVSRKMVGSKPAH
jgi:predicted RNA-binding Zn-ribbon protein involved in translation (DUF1610 family)